MTGTYMSGTGNTKYCMEYLFKELGANEEPVPIEAENIKEQVEK